MNIHLGLKGKYGVTVRRPNGSEARLQGNLITDQGLFWLNRLGVGSGQPGAGQPFDAHCHLGTGTDAPAAGDTALGARVATVPVASRSVWRDPDSNYEVHEFRSHYEFPVGAVVGTISEVGVGPVSTNSGICSRALILDGAGAPDPIVVTSADSVTVDFAVETYVDSTGYLTGTINAIPYVLQPRGVVETVVPALGRGFHLLQDGIAPAGTAAPDYLQGISGGRVGGAASAWPNVGAKTLDLLGANSTNVVVPASQRVISYPSASSQKHVWTITEAVWGSNTPRPLTGIWVPLIGKKANSIPETQVFDNYSLQNGILLGYVGTFTGDYVEINPVLGYNKGLTEDMVNKQVTLEFTISWSNA